MQMRLPEALLGDLGNPARLEARAEIRRMRADGYGPNEIARSLNVRGIATPTGRGRWWPSTVTRFADPAARAAWAAYMRRYRTPTR